MLLTQFFELKTMVVSVSFCCLGKKLQLYAFDPMFRSEDDGRVGFLLLLRKRPVEILGLIKRHTYTAPLTKIPKKFL